jgi:hypothetical protein
MNPVLMLDADASLQTYLTELRRLQSEHQIPLRSEIVLRLNPTYPQKAYYRYLLESFLPFLTDPCALKWSSFALLASKLHAACVHPMLLLTKSEYTSQYEDHLRYCLKRKPAAQEGPFADTSLSNPLLSSSAKMVFLHKYLIMRRLKETSILYVSSSQVVAILLEYLDSFWPGAAVLSIDQTETQRGMYDVDSYDVILIAGYLRENAWLHFGGRRPATVCMFESSWIPDLDVGNMGSTRWTGPGVATISFLRLLIGGSIEDACYSAAVNARMRPLDIRMLSKQNCNDLLSSFALEILQVEDNIHRVFLRSTFAKVSSAFSHAREELGSYALDILIRGACVLLLNTVTLNKRGFSVDSADPNCFINTDMTYPGGADSGKITHIIQKYGCMVDLEYISRYLLIPEVRPKLDMATALEATTRSADFWRRYSVDGTYLFQMARELGERGECIGPHDPYMQSVLRYLARTVAEFGDAASSVIPTSKAFDVLLNAISHILHHFVGAAQRWRGEISVLQNFFVSVSSRMHRPHQPQHQQSGSSALVGLHNQPSYYGGNSVLPSPAVKDFHATGMKRSFPLMEQQISEAEIPSFKRPAPSKIKANRAILTPETALLAKTEHWTEFVKHAGIDPDAERIGALGDFALAMYEKAKSIFADISYYDRIFKFSGGTGLEIGGIFIEKLTSTESNGVEREVYYVCFDAVKQTEGPLGLRMSRSEEGTNTSIFFCFSLC